MGYKQVLGILTVVLTFVGFVPYFISIAKGKAKPHVFSWIIWGITTLIVFLVQVEEKGGAGSWSTGLSTFTTFATAAIAYFKKSDDSITFTDWVFFVAALASLPLWYFASDPFWAVVILTIVDLCGFGPTFRHAYVQPFEEDIPLYSLFVVRSAISIVALENYNLATVLFPAVIGFSSLVFVGMVVYRRKVVLNK